MKLKTHYNKKRSLYNAELNEINNIKFTFREIDIMSCVLKNRGEKKIASLLFISPRTVGSHIHNIMLKLGINSRENIIDFIEKSGKILVLKKYYLHLLVQSLFEQQLIKIAKIISVDKICYNIDYLELTQIEKTHLKRIKENLNLANIVEAKKDSAHKSIHNIYIINKIEYQKSSKNIYLAIDPQINSEELTNYDFIDFRNEDNYYYSLLNLIKSMSCNKDVDKIILDTKKEFDNIADSWDGNQTQKSNSSNIKTNSIKKFLYILCFIVLPLIIFTSIQLFKNTHRETINNVIINSDLLLPQSNTLLDQHEILDAMKEKLSNKSGIRTVALVGIAGSGKTTLARRYARSSEASLIWEINTENHEAIIDSLKGLAHALCKSQEEKNEFSKIENIQDIHLLERSIYLFLSKVIHNFPDWIIIYDKVKSFQDIMKYFPYDETIWGDGRIIITTNNVNISLSNYIADENLIYVEELNDQQKFDLFYSIISTKNNRNKESNSSYTNCLKNIPPFPLDISIAAHYIKETNIKCDKYLQYNSSSKTKFNFAQKNTLKDIGEYTKTRYDIITLSIKHLIDISDDYKDLLFFISMIDFHDIPKNLLYTYKDEITVNSFLRELKKFSLTSHNIKNSGLTFSIHRSTHDIILQYFLQNSQKKHDSKKLQKIISALEKYMISELENYDLETIKLLVPHIESFLNRDSLFSEVDKVNLHNKLGICYFSLAKYIKAKKLLENTLSIYQKYYGENHTNTARTLSKLGIVHRNIGNYNKAQKMLEKAFTIYQKNYTPENKELTWIAVSLGSVYRHIGCFDKSIEILRKYYDLCNKIHGPNHVKSARSAAYLANVYKDVGRYEEAEVLLKKALETYLSYYDEKHTKVAWASVRLSSVYRALGKNQKALELCKKAREIYQQYNAQNCIENAWVLGHLGIIHSNIGDYDKSIQILTESLELYNEHIQNNNIIIGWVKYHLGDTYRMAKDYKKATQLLTESLLIHKKYYKKDNIKVAQILSSLGQNYYKTGNMIKTKESMKSALRIFKKRNHPDYTKTKNIFSKMKLD